MSRLPPCAAAVSLLALSVSAYAIALIPTKVRNDSPVRVRIVVTRFANCLGPEKSRSGDWTIETKLAPHQDGTLLLMGGAEGLCSGGVRSITIVAAPTAAIPNPRAILPLSITSNFPNHWLPLRVQVDAGTNRFILRAANAAR